MAVDVNLIGENVIENENRITLSVSLSVKVQSNTSYAIKTLLGILAYVLVSLIELIKLKKF